MFEQSKKISEGLEVKTMINKSEREILEEVYKGLKNPLKNRFTKKES